MIVQVDSRDCRQENDQLKNFNGTLRSPMSKIEFVYETKKMRHATRKNLLIATSNKNWQHTTLARVVPPTALFKYDASGPHIHLTSLLHHSIHVSIQPALSKGHEGFSSDRPRQTSRHYCISKTETERSTFRQQQIHHRQQLDSKSRPRPRIDTPDRCRSITNTLT